MAAPVKVVVDLRSKLPPVRDQGQRPTCLVFAATDAHSFSLNSTQMLSVEYLHYFAVGRMPQPDPAVGITLGEAADTLANDGQPVEASWPYSPTQPNPWAPPATVGEIWKRGAAATNPSPADVEQHIRNGKPVVLGLRVTESFYDPPNDPCIIEGIGDPNIGLHAVLVVGVGESDQSGTCLLIRNSWGADWGFEGHAWLPVPYLENRIRGSLDLA